VATQQANGGVGFARKSTLDKAKQTNKAIFGCENISQTTDRKNKLSLNNPMYDKDVVDKLKASNLRIYGSECVLKNANIRDGISKTNLRKYGTENAGSLTINEALNIKMGYKYKAFENMHLCRPLFDRESYEGLGNEYEWECLTCGNIFSQTLSSNRLNPVCV
jgi:hypothetical protein